VSKFIEISVDQESIKTVEKSLKEYGVHAAKALMDAIYRTALAMETDAKRRLNGQLGSAKHWITGRLASSVHAEVKGKNTFAATKASEGRDGSFGLPIDDLEALVGTNVVYGPNIEFGFDSFIQFAATKQSPELPKRIEKELNKLATKFNK
jgi:hypothetical protein